MLQTMLLGAMILPLACPPCPEGPFEAPGETAPWRRTRTGLFTVTQGGPAHRGQDVLVRVGAPVRLMGKFAYGPVDKDLKGEDVEVWLRRGWCGPFVQVGERRTTRDGERGVVDGLADDGGRVFFELPAAARPGVGQHRVVMRAKGDHSVAAFDLVVVRLGTQAVVFDIDATLTTRDAALNVALVERLRDHAYEPKARPGAADVASAWARRGFLIVYLSGRPDLLRGVTRDWLRRHGFPSGVLLLNDRLRDVWPTRERVGRAKLKRLQRLVGQVALHAAYGNANTDARAYSGAGIPRSRTFLVGPHAGQWGTQPVASYPQHLAAVAAGAAASVAAPQLRWARVP